MPGLSRGRIEVLKKTYTEGVRVQLVEMDDEQAPPVGTLGTVYFVDDMGSILVQWDNGSSLSLIPNKDKWKTLKG